MATLSPHYDALTGVVAQIQAAGLEELDGSSTPLPADRVYLRLQPTQRVISVSAYPTGFKPSIVVSLPVGHRGAQVWTAMDDADDEIVYPCLVTVLIKKDQDLTLNESDLRWWHQIADVFGDKRPDQVPELVSALDPVNLLCTHWQPGVMVDESLWRNAGLLASEGVVLVDTSRTVR